MNVQNLRNHLLAQAERVEELQTALTAIPALGPDNGGQGEFAKAEYVQSLLHGADAIMRLDSPDPRVESGLRPNIIAIYNGRLPRKLWLFAHLDVVPAGDETQWRQNPWVVRKDGDMLYGRGVEDNQQAIVSMLLLAESIRNFQPELTLGLVFMADEENGSRHGLSWILRSRPDLFQPDDFYIVPDGGSPDASAMEIAEKGQLWLKFTIYGKQCHASTPEAGINAFAAACELVCQLQKLKDIFPAQNSLFVPPWSTFAPTMHKGGSEAVNIISGREVFWLDCRLLPEVDKDELCKIITEFCEQIAGKTGAKIEWEEAQSQQASETSKDAPVVAALKRAIKSVYGITGRPVGIGGATVAAFLRQKGLPAVVWACLQNTCHQPDECSSILATMKDAAVFAEILMDSGDA